MLVARRILVTSLLTVLALSLVGNASAAAAAVSVVGLPETLETPIGQNGTAELSFTVQFVADGFVCAQAGTATIALALNTAGLPAGVTAALSAETVDVPIPQGAYVAAQEPVGRTFNGSSPTVTIALTAGPIEANATGSVDVTATYAAGAPTNCTGDLPGAEATGKANLATVAPPPPPEPTPEPPEKGLPAPSVVGALAAVGAALLVRRFRP